MTTLQLNPSDIIIRIKVQKEITNKDIINNFISNLFVVGGDIANNIIITLTKTTLYLEYKGHTQLGYAEETRKIDSIPLTDIKDIHVFSKDLEEFIKITTSNNSLLFIRNNSNKDNLAMSLVNNINSLK